MSIFRNRPHWYMLVFHYGLGLVVAWKLVQDLRVGQSQVYSGHFFPWRQYVNWTDHCGESIYWVLVGAEAILLIFYFLRIKVRVTALLLAAVLFADGLGSLQNHRLLMVIELFLISLCPVPATASASGFRGKHVYWNLDLVRWQLSIVYFFTVIHKCNVQFLSGETLQNLFWMTHTHGMKTYPNWLWNILLNPDVCMFLAWLTIATELSLAIALNCRRLVRWLLPAGLAMHFSMALLMGYIWIFSVLVVFSFVAFLPDRVQSGTYRLRFGSRRWLWSGIARLTWPGYVGLVADKELGHGWALEMPDGQCVSGYDAWVELLSLSPLTFLFAEILRIGVQQTDDVDTPAEVATSYQRDLSPVTGF